MGRRSRRAVVGVAVLPQRRRPVQAVAVQKAAAVAPRRASLLEEFESTSRDLWPSHGTCMWTRQGAHTTRAREKGRGRMLREPYASHSGTSCGSSYTDATLGM